MVLEPTTSRLDLPLLCRLSCEASTGACRGNLGSESRTNDTDIHVVLGPHSTPEIATTLIFINVWLVGNTADTPDPPGLLGSPK